MITQQDIQALVNAASQANLKVGLNQLQLNRWHAGIKSHKPTAFPVGFSAIYIFEYNKVYLKVGQAGPNSNARFQSHHYNPHSSNSNLAKSLINDAGFAAIIGTDEVGLWIKKNTDRYNIMIPIMYNSKFVNFAEAFFILKCNPKFEK